MGMAQTLIFTTLSGKVVYSDSALIKTGSHPDQLIRFYRGTTKVFNEDFTLAYWAGTRVKESTDSEWMKTVKYDGSIQLRTPRQMASGVGVTVQDLEGSL